MEHGIKRTSDQLGAIVEDFQLDPGRERAADGCQLLLGSLDHATAVLAADHHHHAGDHLTSLVPRGSPLPHERRNRHIANHANQHRHPTRRAPHNDLPDILDASEERLPPNKTLLPILHDIATASAIIVAIQCPQHLAERYPLRGNPVGIYLHGIALRKASVTIDIRYARDFPHGRRDLPLQQTAKIHQALPRSLHLKLQNFPQCCGKRAELGIAVAQSHSIFGLRQTLCDELPCKEDVGSLAKHNRYERNPKSRDAPHFLHVWQATHGQLDRIRDVAFHFQRGEGAGLRDHLHLNIDQIGNSVDRNLRGRVQPSDGHEYKEGDH